MAKIYINVIESSSKANCININDSKTNIFLDFGTKYENIDKFYNLNKIKLESVKACLITHAHTDHIRAIYKNKNSYIVFYCTRETKYLINKTSKILNNNNCVVVDINKWIKIKDTNWKIKAIPTIHNILGSVCYVIKNKNKKILYLTDTQYFENKNFKNLNCYIIESNYGTDDIIGTSKFNKHIVDNKFHMNLHESLELVKTHFGNKTKLTILMHLSWKNKTSNIEKHLNWINTYSKKNKYKYVKPNLLFSDKFIV